MHVLEVALRIVAQGVALKLGSDRIWWFSCCPSSRDLHLFKDGAAAGKGAQGDGAAAAASLELELTYPGSPPPKDYRAGEDTQGARIRRAWRGAGRRGHEQSAVREPWLHPLLESTAGG
jgi:hypothetical protein